MRATSPKERLRDMANHAVRRQIEKGKLVRPETCSKCKEKGKIQAHHDSYFKEDFLKVRWLCPLCHSEWHRLKEPKSPLQTETPPIPSI